MKPVAQEQLKARANQSYYEQHREELQARSRTTAKELRERQRIEQCEKLVLPEFLAPYLRVNKCTLALVAMDRETLLEMCRDIVDHQDYVDSYMHPIGRR